MRRITKFVQTILFGCLVLGSVSHGRSMAARPEGRGQFQNVFIVAWHPSVDEHEGKRAVGQANGVLRHSFSFSHGASIELPDKAALERLQHDPRIVSIVPNRPLTIEPIWPQSPPTCLDCEGGGGDPPPPNNQVIPLVLNKVGATQLPYTGQNVGVAVVDSGIWDIHRDFVRPDGTSIVKKNWYPFGVTTDCWRMETYYVGCGDAEPSPGGHGTSVAGIIAAANNTVDVVGVAPNATLYNFMVYTHSAMCTNGYIDCASLEYVVGALDWIAGHHSSVSPPIKVVNISLGDLGSLNETSALNNALRAIKSAGIVTVAAAGNVPSQTVSQRVPANSMSVMAIASTAAQAGVIGPGCSGTPVPEGAASWYTTDGALSPVTNNGFSGLVGVTISAPGEDQEDIVQRGVCSNNNAIGCGTAADCGTATPSPTCINLQCRPYHVGTWVLKRAIASMNDGPNMTMRAAGTSISAPVVSGIVALMKERAAFLGQTLNLEDARTKIRATAISVGSIPLNSPYTGYTFDGEREGMIFAPSALYD